MCKCFTCGKEIQPIRVKNNNFCSRECYHTSMREKSFQRKAREDMWTKLFPPFKVKCPKCNKQQLFKTMRNVTKCSKKCVYCGCSFKIYTPGGLDRRIGDDNGEKK